MSDPHPESEEQPPREVGEGYPEDAPPDTGIDPHEHAEQEVGEDADDGPDTSAPDSEPSHATGNPRAAGG